ncbi:MAG: hypothetical protein NZX77_19295, partial [Polyangiaceae bacterium]|nr:hypothetical protein [Polyangiaceae bacterium]
MESASIEDLDEIPAEDLKSELPPPPEEVSSFVRVDLTLVHFTSELLETIPQEIAEQHGVLPVYLRKTQKRTKTSIPGILYVAASNPEDRAALEDCALCSNMKVRAFRADPQEIHEAIPIVYRGGLLARPQPSTASLVFAPPPPPVSTNTKVKAPPPPPPVRATSNNMPELPLSCPPTQAVTPQSSSSESPTDPPLPKALPPNRAPASTSDIRSTSSTSPWLVILGNDLGLTDYCHEAIAPLGGRVETWELGRASEMKPEISPSLLLVSEELYLFDRRAFNLLA